MENTRPILYGVAGYAEIRQVNAWFIDRILISTSSRRGGERDVNEPFPKSETRCMLLLS